MAIDKKKVHYKHFVPPVKEIPEWYKMFNFILVESLEELQKIWDKLKDTRYIIAWDTETSSLDPEASYAIGIVGFSFCTDGKTAYYVAVNHYYEKYNLGEAALDIFYEMLCGSFKNIPFNARFDMRFMEYQGYDPKIHDERFMYVKYDMSKVRKSLYDVSNACWLADTNIKMPTLKKSALHFLGYKMQTFAEVSDGAENFYYINPEDCYFYASSDALCTYLLAGATRKYFEESGYAGTLDNVVLYPLMHYEQERIFLDKKLLKVLVLECQTKLDILERDIYEAAGGVFKLNSPAQVSNAFSNMGIDTGERTKTGYMKTGIELLENLPSEVKAQHPLLAKFIEFKTLYKFLSSYVKVLHKMAEDQGFARCNYKNQVVPTGRLASGKDAKNSYFSSFNIQSSPKPHPMLYYVRDLKDRTLYNKKDNIIMGFKFIPVQYDDSGNMIEGDTLYEDFLYLVEGFDPKDNIRSVYLPKLRSTDKDEDFIFCSIDFSGQELRIAANLSKEPVWIEAFLNGGDIHKETAYKIWGKDNYDKEKRKMAKAANFSIIYGASSYSFIGEGKTAEKPEGMTQQEAEEFFNNYKEGLPTLFAYQNKIIRFCSQKGVVYTQFRRPRRVKFYFQNGQAGFGRRTILNTPIQGAAGDILKIVMCRVWKDVLDNPKYKEDVAFKCTVHDEINYGIRKERALEIGRLLEETMTFNIADWEVPLTVEISFGWNWGSIFDFVWNNEEKVYYPKKA